MNKKFIARVAKIALALAFLWNAGLPDLLVEIAASNWSGEKISIEEEMARSKQLQQKIKEAKQLGNSYRAENYFVDLVDLRSKKLDQIPFAHTKITELQQLALQNSKEDEMIVARDKHYYELDPISPEREKEIKKFQERGGIWGFAKRSYFWLMPWVFILFVIWQYENNQNKKKMFKNPLSFILCFIFYPVIFAVVLFRVWQSTQREIRAKIDIRRTKENLFSLLSDDEIAAVKRFAQSKISLKKWRQEQFGTTNPAFRHSFAGGLIAVMILLIIPTQIFAKNLTVINHSAIINITVLAEDNSPPGDNSLDDDSKTWLAVSADLLYQCLLGYIYHRERGDLQNGYLLEIIHVPLTVS